MPARAIVSIVLLLFAYDARAQQSASPPDTSEPERPSWGVIDVAAFYPIKQKLELYGVTSHELTFFYF